MSISLLFFLVALKLAAGKPHHGLDGRIVGGIETTIEEHPYQVSLQYNKRHICGASLISRNVVLTAAHCVHGTDHSRFHVRIGSSNDDKGGFYVKVLKIKQHAEYDDKTADYDVALGFLSEEVTVSSKIQYISLAEKEFKTGTMAYVTGWGMLTSSGPTTNKLSKVDVPTISRDECRRKYPSELISDRMTCAGYAEGGKDACQGDSGGPLVANGVQIGIVSWGYGCGVPRRPGVYTNVPVLYKWITENSKL